jgi:YHS domain-containing protein
MVLKKEFTMQRSTVFICAILSIGATLLVAGCGQSKSANKSATGGTKTETARNEAAPNDGRQSASSEDEAEITKALAALSPEDRALAMKQKVCPVSGEALGKMGPPLKMEVKGQTVFLCCEGCKDQLLAKPDEYLARIKQQ